MNKDMRGEKFLIFARAAVHCKAVEATREMGVYTIVTDNLSKRIRLPG